MKPATQSSGSSIFGQTNTPKPQGGIFGGGQQQQTTTSLGAFGQPSTQNQPAQGTSIFGTPLGQNPQQQQQQQQPAGSTLFGTSLGQTPQTQTGQSTSLFGTPLGQNPQMQAGQSTGLFGTSLGQNPQQQQTQTGQSSGLFGGAFGQMQQQPQQQPSTTGIFGQSVAQSGPFGGTQNQPQQQSTLGAFGSLGTQPTSGGWGLGSTTTQPAQQAGGSSFLGGSTLGGSLWGKPATQTPFGGQTVPQPTGPPPFTKSTKFNDLPDQVKKIFEGTDAFIQARVQISNDLKQRKLGEEALKGQEDVRALHKDLTNAISVLRSDVLHTRDLKSKVEQTVQDTIVATRIVEGFKNPQQHGAYLKNHAEFPLEFFNRVTEQMAQRLRWYKATIEQIERKLSSAASQPQYTPQAISSTLEAQHATFIALASKTAALDAELQKLRTLYTQLWRAKTGSMRDPFNELDRGSGGDFGLESLSAK
ncbi:Nucleoporin nup45 [Grifola frondosa]|uniref:Nucleoporin nup45 n=1 Tax=Grifola frondosa TaxID=5627 RepID=A0A1C7LJ66_GRIFR|nr:Nucleoporin nup45 [Grifola frondosa]